MYFWNTFFLSQCIQKRRNKVLFILLEFIWRWRTNKALWLTSPVFMVISREDNVGQFFAVNHYNGSAGLLSSLQQIHCEKCQPVLSIASAYSIRFKPVPWEQTLQLQILTITLLLVIQMVPVPKNSSHSEHRHIIKFMYRRLILCNYSYLLISNKLCNGRERTEQGN